ncbi:MAG: Ig-like domain-containing protein [Candidatus Methanomethylophilaceae archaeon]
MKNKKIAAIILIAMLSSVFVMAIPPANADGDTSEIVDASYFDGIIDVSGHFEIGYADSHTEVRVMSGTTTVVSGICITDNNGFFSVSIKKEGLEAGVYDIVAISLPVGKPSVTISKQMEVFETESINLNVSEKVLVVGNSFKLEAETIPATVHYPMIWSSSDPSKVSVDDEGNITAISEGEAKIKVTIGDLEAECTVIVTIKATLSKTEYVNELFGIAGTFGNYYGNTNVEVQITSGTTKIASGMCISENDGSFSVSVLKKNLNPGDYDIVAICQPIGIPSLTATASMSVYKITWSVDGVETDECYSEGLIPEYKGDMGWVDDAGNEYIITGWTPDISEVTENCEYEAVTEEVIPTFTVTFLDGYDSVYYTETVSLGEDASAPTDAPGKRSRTHDYVFLGWSGEFTNVTENITLSPEYDAIPAEMMSAKFSVSQDSLIFTSPYTVTFNKNGFDLEPYGYSKKQCSTVSEGATLTHLFVAAHEDFFETDEVSSLFVFSASGWNTKFWGVEFKDFDFFDMTYFLDGVMVEDLHTEVPIEEGCYAEANLFNYFINGLTTFDKVKTEAGFDEEISLTVPTNPEKPYWLPSITFEGLSFYYTVNPVKNIQISELTGLAVTEALVGDDYVYTFSFPEPGVYYVCAYRESVADEYGIIAEVFGAPISWCEVTVTGNRVTFDANGGVGSIDDVFAADGDELELPTQGISKATHVLAGWSLTPGGALVAEPYVVTSDTVLYAVWTPIIYEDLPSEDEFADLIEQEETPVLNVKSSATDTVLNNNLFKDLDKPLVVNVLDDNGEVQYSWSFDGEYKENAGTLKLGISKTESSEAITSAIGKLDMENPLVLNFAASGELPNNAVISYRVSDTYEDGTVLNLFFYNEETGALELQAENLVVSGGMISFGLTHCSTFVLAEGISEEPPAEDDGVFSSVHAVIILAAGIVLAIAVVFLIWRRA